MIYEILGLFVNKLTADDKYFLHNSENFSLAIQLQLSKKQETFSEIFAPLLKSTSTLRISYLFPKLQKAKDVL